MEFLGQGQDLVLASEEGQHFALLLLVVDLQDGVEGRLQVVLHRVEQVVYLGGVGAPFYSHDGVAAEELHELVGLDGSRHDDYLEFVLASLHSGLEQGHQDIGVDAPLVRLVQHEDIEHAPRHQLPDRHAVGHEHHPTLDRSLLLEPNTVADLLPHCIAHLLRHPLGQGDGADPPGLRDQDAPEVAEQVLGHLGGLAAASLPADHCGLVGTN